MAKKVEIMVWKHLRGFWGASDALYVDQVIVKKCVCVGIFNQVVCI